MITETEIPPDDLGVAIRLIDGVEKLSVYRRRDVDLPNAGDSTYWFPRHQHDDIWDLVELDPKREFSRAQKRRRFQQQKGVCLGCNLKTRFVLMAGDHRHAWIDGGHTIFANLDDRCYSCNLIKSSQSLETLLKTFERDKVQPGDGHLRDWQIEAQVVALENFKVGTPVLIEAWPGAGKTRLALEVAYALYKAGLINRILIFVHTDALVQSWRDTVSSDSPADPTFPQVKKSWKASDGMRCDETLQEIVVVSTYQSLTSMADMYQSLAAEPGHRTLVILDEVHHLGKDKKWGGTAVAAFMRHAAYVLSLSGTPFRTGKDPIAFVPHEGGSAKPQYRYGYRRGLRESVNRPVEFPTIGGTARVESEDGSKFWELSFDGEDELLSAADRRARHKAFRTCFAPGTGADMMLQFGHQFITWLRARNGSEYDGDAAGLVVCADCTHGQLVADYMEKHVLGFRPEVAWSDKTKLAPTDDHDSTRVIRQFRNGSKKHKPWIVAVNMISEGIDIRRIRCIVFLTNRMTRTNFIQVLGRGIRSDANNHPDYAIMLMPPEEKLLGFVHEVLDGVDLLPNEPELEEEPHQPADGRPGGKKKKTKRKDSLLYSFLGEIGDCPLVREDSINAIEAKVIKACAAYVERRGLKKTDWRAIYKLALEDPSFYRIVMSEDAA